LDSKAEADIYVDHASFCHIIPYSPPGKHQPRTAIVTNVQNELYVPNSIVLGYTIQKHNPNLVHNGTELILMIPHKHDITEISMARLKVIGWVIRYEDDVVVEGIENILIQYRRNYINLRIWRWVEYRKIAFIDCLVMGDISLLLFDMARTISVRGFAY